MKKWIPLLVLVALLLALVPSVMAEDSSAAAKNVDRFSTSYYCDAPESLSYKVSGTTVKLSWPSYWLDDGYVIKENINGTWVQLGTTTGTSFTLKNVTKGTHRFGVATYWGSPDLIQSWNIRYVDVKVSAATVGKPSVTLKQTGTKKVKLTWKKTSNATSYVVYRSTKKSSGFKKIKTLKKVTYTDTVPKTNKTYYYKVVAKGKVNGKTKTATSAVKKIKVTKDYNKTGKFLALLVVNTYPGTSDELPGPDTDAYAFAAMLKNMSGVDVTTKINVTASQITSNIKSLFANATDKDVSIFYYSGHGVQAFGSEYHGALCGTGNTYITAKQLREAFNGIPGKKVIFIDSCHSGNLIGKSSGDNAAAVKAELDAFNQAFVDAFASASKSSTNLAADGFYVITAAHSSESSLSVTASGKWVGLMTIGLLDGCGYDEVTSKVTGSYPADTDGNGQFTIKEVYNYIKKYITANRPGSQSTQYYWPSGGDTQVIWKR